jgi:hypothetical protein
MMAGGAVVVATLAVYVLSARRGRRQAPDLTR